VSTFQSKVCNLPSGWTNKTVARDKVGYSKAVRASKRAEVSGRRREQCRTGNIFCISRSTFPQNRCFRVQIVSLLFFTSLFSYFSPPPTFHSFSLLTLASSHPILICNLFLYFVFTFLANVLTTISASFTVVITVV
jgi:hypothetical protein